MEKQRLFDDYRVEEIMSELDWNRLFREVYGYVRSYSIDELNSLEFFMYGGNLRIEIWHWVGNEWKSIWFADIKNHGEFHRRVESCIRRGLRSAMI